MVSADLVDGRRPHHLLVPDGPRPERMAGRIRQLAPGFVRDAAGVLLRFLEVGQRVRPYELERFGREGRRDDGLGDEVDERGQVVREALPGEDRRMRADMGSASSSAVGGGICPPPSRNAA